MEREVIEMTEGKDTKLEGQEQARIVVGVDGSECAGRALDFAAHAAARWDAILEVVAVFGIPPVAGLSLVVLDPFEDAAGQILDSAMAQVAASEPSVVAKGECHYGNAAQILLARSQDAVLLVVGSRGRGEVKSLVLGSVSEDCVHRASCPVTVVH
jgi:nucleotide-binding universal stress UspA family protein